MKMEEVMQMLAVTLAIQAKRFCVVHEIKLTPDELAEKFLEPCLPKILNALTECETGEKLHDFIEQQLHETIGKYSQVLCN